MVPKVASFAPPPQLISCFLFIILLYAIPHSCNAARKLTEIPQNGTSTEGKDHSKSGIRGSISHRAGSANGQPSPTGNVMLSPPAALTKVHYENGQPSNNSPPDPYQGDPNNNAPPSYQGNGYSPSSRYPGYYPGNGYYTPPPPGQRNGYYYSSPGYSQSPYNENPYGGYGNP